MLTKSFIISILIFLLNGFQALSQKGTFLHFGGNDGIVHRVYMTKDYLIETAFAPNTGDFAFTRGGFYTVKDQKLIVSLEFNSNFPNDNLREVVFEDRSQWIVWEPIYTDIENYWQFSGRVNLEGQEQRRDLKLPRKTIKILEDGFFQWIAFNTETMEFSGTGGGKYMANNGVYREFIQYFSRDKSRVGAELSFDYELTNGEWHHKGFSSKGDPLHEIWVPRPDIIK